MNNIFTFGLVIIRILNENVNHKQYHVIGLINFNILTMSSLQNTVVVVFSFCPKIQNFAHYRASYLCDEYDCRLKQILCLCNAEFDWFVGFELTLEHYFHIIYTSFIVLFV